MIKPLINIWKTTCICISSFSGEKVEAITLKVSIGAEVKMAETDRRVQQIHNLSGRYVGPGMITSLCRPAQAYGSWVMGPSNRKPVAESRPTGPIEMNLFSAQNLGRLRNPWPPL